MMNEQQQTNDAFLAGFQKQEYVPDAPQEQPTEVPQERVTPSDLTWEQKRIAVVHAKNPQYPQQADYQYAKAVTAGKSFDEQQKIYADLFTAGLKHD